jgi:AcrR family transcriptional regulator
MFLEVAARLIGEQGYESVTMTAIAEHSHASIGALYDYFRDKQTIAQALATQYAEEADEHWKQLLGRPSVPDRTALAELLIEGALKFARERPAYLPLFGAPLVFSRSAAARLPLRRTFADALRKLNPEMTADRAFISAQVVVELIKGLFAVCKQIDPKNKDVVTVEFKRLMRFYLTEIVE